jgi:DNA-directed RNA polymerase specialized sigma24 family protein
MLSTPAEVVTSLLTYTDWWQPSTTSVLHVGQGRRDQGLTGPFRPGLLETLDERTELSQRMQAVDERDRRLLFLWYVRQLEATDIARSLGISRRQCFRRRARAIRAIVEFGYEREDGSVGAA